MNATTASGPRMGPASTTVQATRYSVSKLLAVPGTHLGRPPGAGEALETKAVWLLGLDPDRQQKLCQQQPRELRQDPDLELD